MNLWIKSPRVQLTAKPTANGPNLAAWHGRRRRSTFNKCFGTVHPKDAVVLTAKLAAILSDGGNRQRTLADPG